MFDVAGTHSHHEHTKNSTRERESFRERGTHEDFRVSAESSAIPQDLVTVTKLG